MSDAISTREQYYKSTALKVFVSFLIKYHVIVIVATYIRPKLYLYSTDSLRVKAMTNKQIGMIKLTGYLFCHFAYITLKASEPSSGFKPSLWVS